MNVAGKITVNFSFLFFSASLFKTLVLLRMAQLLKGLSAKVLQVFLLRSITKPEGRKGLK